MGTGTVLIGDLWYTSGTFFLALVEGFQFWYYPRGENLLSLKTVVFITFCWIFIIVNMFLIDVQNYFISRSSRSFKKLNHGMFSVLWDTLRF